MTTHNKHTTMKNQLAQINANVIRKAETTASAILARAHICPHCGKTCDNGLVICQYCGANRLRTSATRGAEPESAQLTGTPDQIMEQLAAWDETPEGKAFRDANDIRKPAPLVAKMPPESAKMPSGKPGKHTPHWSPFTESASNPAGVVDERLQLVAHVFGDSKEIRAQRSKLIAAAPETAAECDKLASKVAGLVHAFSDMAKTHDKLEEQVKTLLAVCNRLAGSRLFSIDFEANRTPGTEQTDLRDMLIAAIKDVEAR